MENLDVDDIIVERQKEAIENAKVDRRPPPESFMGNDEDPDGPV